MKWIDPKKDTPKNGELVFLCFEHSSYPKKGLAGTGFIDHGEWIFGHYTTTADKKILHIVEGKTDSHFTIKYWAKIELPTTTTKKERVSNRFELLDL